MQQSSRYLIGIDLGTTNSVVAYIDTQGDSEIRTVEIPQLVAPGEVRSLPALPSFLYFPTEQENESGAARLPWEERPETIVGAMARDHGSMVPARQVMSAKSWLSNGGVDRTANILPRDADPPLISPVDASARYLQQMRTAWDLAFAEEPGAAFDQQEVYLTVPASFDEEARELTVEAAHSAGIHNFILLEEPLAAFYSWTATHQATLKDELHDGDLVLICDIGGGTSDFSLVRARVNGDEVQFERKAIGEHLLLGGDNLDLALTHVVQSKLQGARLSVRQRHALQRACSAAKEQLLSEPGLDRVPITILGGGRQVVGQMVTSELLREEVLGLLSDGFLPLTSADEMPKRGRSAGLREIGLPYVGDPAITKHLAAFLRQAAKTIGTDLTAQGLARPDAVLFNGGFCEPEIARQRIVEAVGTWFSNAGEWRPRVLRTVSLGSAVAQGAAHYGRVRRGTAVRVQAGSARSYYIGLRTEQGLQAVCVLPAGVQEGTTLPLTGRDFAVRANRPVSFDLFSSRTRHDAHGVVAVLDPEQVHRHAPLVTLLRYGKKLRDVELDVRLSVIYTELGTLELWCESTNSPHRWRLQFELRTAEVQTDRAADPERKLPSSELVGGTFKPGVGLTGAEKEAVAEAVRKLRDVFGGEASPDALTGALESALGSKRDSWSVEVIRGLADALMETGDGRKKSPRHEVRWLNLLGFCLRPGFGAAGDDNRIREVRKFNGGPVFAREPQCEVEFLVMLRRMCGGFNAAQQHELYRRYSASLRPQGKKPARLNPQVEYDSWRLLASLEYLPVTIRTSLGNDVFARVRKNLDDLRWVWPLARLGARIPFSGPLSCVLSPDAVAPWITFLLQRVEMTPEVTSAIVQLARRTGDTDRDIADDLRKQVLRALKDAGVAPDSIRPIDKFVPPDRADAVRSFGDSLPRDLRLVSSANCLLSFTALTQTEREAVS